MTDAEKKKIKKFKQEIKKLTHEGVKDGLDHQTAKSIAYAVVRPKAFKVLGFVPDGFYWDKTHDGDGE